MRIQQSKYRGFEFTSLRWGNQDLFKRIIDKLYDEGMLGEENANATELFFNFLKKNEITEGFEHVLKSFLRLFEKPTFRFILQREDLLRILTETGYAFALKKMYMGFKFFELLAKGGLGDTPFEIEHVLRKTRGIITYDIDLTYEFVTSYKYTRKFLRYDALDPFLEKALMINDDDPTTGKNFIALKTSYAKEYVKSLSIEARLPELRERLKRYLFAILKRRVDVRSVYDLKQELLTKRETDVLVLPATVYLPERITVSANGTENTERYFLIALIAAVSLIDESFPVIHGHKGAETSYDFFYSEGYKNPRIFNNIFTAIEVFRILLRATERFPGATPALLAMLAHEAETCENNILAALLKRCANAILPRAAYEEDEKQTVLLSFIETTARASRSFIETYTAIEKLAETKATALHKDIDRAFSKEIEWFTFISDFLYPVKMTNDGYGDECDRVKQRVANTKSEFDEKELDETVINREINREEIDLLAIDAEVGTGTEEAEEPLAKEKDGNGDERNYAERRYYYNEWDELQHDYYVNWCHLREKRVFPSKENYTITDEVRREVERVKRVFERLRPERMKRQKRLSIGDDINIDHLVEFLSLRKAKVDVHPFFYEKPFIEKRDVAVALLLDISGSTNRDVENGKRIIDFEKEAAFILAEGLADLGDMFGLFGFTGYGRSNAQYYIMKAFNDTWDEHARQSLFSALVGTSTRMGVALRHTQTLMTGLDAKTKIIITITDGQPTDMDYKPETRYAQYDVRKANEENYKEGIHTFCITTDATRTKDLEIMFPFHRYVVLESITELPAVLSRFYFDITQ